MTRFPPRVLLEVVAFITLIYLAALVNENTVGHIEAFGYAVIVTIGGVIAYFYARSRARASTDFGEESP